MVYSSRPLPPMLEAKLRQVAREHRRRLQLRLRLRVGFFLLALFAFLAAALWLSELAQWPFIIPCALVFFVAVLAARYWLRPPQRRDLAIEEVAQLVDQHYPELENLVLSSVEFSREGYRAPSEWIVARVLENADWHSRDIAVDELANTHSLRRLKTGGLLLWSLVVALLVFAVGQVDFARIRAGFFVPIAYVELPFVVEPGDVRVRYGGEQTVWVRGADPELSAALRWRRAQGPWQSASLLPGRVDGVHHFRLRDLLDDVEYQVQVGPRRSPSYRIEVWMPPQVEGVALRYKYPHYLGLAPREVLDGGHITALVGSEVELEITVNKELHAAALVFESGVQLALRQSSARSWTGQFSVQSDDYYRIELRDKDGNENEMPMRYRVVAAIDEPPALKVHFPRGDDEATALEEIDFSFSVSDDYGLRAYGLEFEIAGREKVRIALGAENATETEREGEYLLALEELNLRAGDLLTWTLWAEDYKPDRSAYETLGDPYFLEIRPFSRDYSEAISDEGGAAAQGGANGGPAADQKQIVIATWNLRRDAETLDEAEFLARRERIEGAQGEVLESAAEQRSPPGREGLVVALRDEVTGALTALANASEPDSTAALTRAMTHQQRAYHYLLQLEPEDRQLTQSNRGQGSGGGSGDNSARDRELQALETSRRRDFREEASTLGEQMQAAEEARDSLEELARRQEFLNEDMAELVADLQSEDEEVRAEAQRQLAELRSEQRRALEALDRMGGQVASGALEAGQRAELRQQLEEARRQMERSAEGLERGETQRARAAGRRAQESLQRAERELDQLSRGGLAQRLEQLGSGLDSLRMRQGAVAKESAVPGGDSAVKQEALAEDFARFMGEAGELAERSGQDLVARKLGDWLRQTSREGIYEDMRESSRQARYGASVQTLQQEVGRKLALARTRLDSLQRYLALDDLDARRKALAQLRDLSAQAMDGGRGRGGAQDNIDQQDSLGRGGAEDRGEEGNSASENRREGQGVAASGDLQDDRDGAQSRAGRNGSTAGDGEEAEGVAAGAGERAPAVGNAAGGAGTSGLPRGDIRVFREALRDARELLPEDSAAREILGNLSESAAGYQEDKALPQYDLLYERAALPLQRAAEVLEREIEVLRGEREVPPTDGREVPPRYRQQVAKYFERLAELEGE